MVSVVLQVRQTVFPAFAVWGSSFPVSVNTSQSLPGLLISFQLFNWNLPPKARSTRRWSVSMKMWDLGSSCSLVKPWGIINWSKVGDRLVVVAFSTFAFDLRLTEM